RRKAIEDNLATSRERLANLEKARSNSELVRLEIDRLENKIQSLSEMAINRQEPDYIVHQVDEVASSMVQTERTMNELQFATGLATEEEVPQLLQRQAITAKKGAPLAARHGPSRLHIDFLNHFLRLNRARRERRCPGWG